MITLGIETIDGGFMFKVQNDKMIGTLHVTDEGVSFNPPNKKLPPDCAIKWEQFETLVNLAKQFGKI